MTEQQYIDATDLAKLRAADRIIRDVLPANSSVVDKESHRAVCRIMQGWTDRLSVMIDIEQEGMTSPAEPRSSWCFECQAPHVTNSTCFT